VEVGSEVWPSLHCAGRGVRGGWGASDLKESSRKEQRGRREGELYGNLSTLFVAQLEVCPKSPGKAVQQKNIFQWFPQEVTG